MGHAAAHAAWDRRDESKLTWGSSPETFEYAFEEGGWVDHGGGCLSCDVHQIYRLQETGDFAYERNLRVQLTIRNSKIIRYEMSIVG
jgi:hypothetical protein